MTNCTQESGLSRFCGIFKGQNYMLKKSDWWNTLKHTSLHPTRLRSTWLQFAYLICYTGSFTFRNAAKEAKRKKGQGPGPFTHYFGVRNFAGVWICTLKIFVTLISKWCLMEGTKEAISWEAEESSARFSGLKDHNSRDHYKMLPYIEVYIYI